MLFACIEICMYHSSSKSSDSSSPRRVTFSARRPLGHGHQQFVLTPDHKEHGSGGLPCISESSFNTGFGRLRRELKTSYYLRCIIYCAIRENVSHGLSLLHEMITCRMSCLQLKRTGLGSRGGWGNPVDTSCYCILLTECCHTAHFLKVVQDRCLSISSTAHLGLYVHFTHPLLC